MFLLFINELTLYIYPDPIETIEIDTTRSKTIKINFDITFHAISCQRIFFQLFFIINIRLQIRLNGYNR